MKIKSKKFVIQKYIEHPLLMDSRKFDIRLFLMVTPNGRVFFYKEMYIRVSAYPFDLDDMGKFGHLNNIALQKYSKEYDGEKAVVTTAALQDYVRSTIKKDFNFDQEIRPRLVHIIHILAACLFEKFNTFHSKKKNFEIFGLDFMIDRDLKVWLIEANTNPAMSTGNSFLDQLIPRMLDDALKIVLDKLFPLPKAESAFANHVGQREYSNICRDYYDSKCPLLDYDDDEVLWKKVVPQDVEEALKINPN